MTFHARYRSALKKPDVACKCSHPKITHYTKEGSCVYPGCGCMAYRTAGNLKFNSNRARCEYGHAHNSGLEIKTCFELHLQKLAGEIKGYVAEKPLDLLGYSREKVISKYKVDFVVDHLDGTTEYIECKGAHLYDEGKWSLKWALLQDMHEGDRKFKFTLIKQT